MFPIQQMLQILKAPNSLEMLRNLTRNNPQQQALLNQLEKMTPQQQQQQLNQMCSKFGITPDKIKNFLGM